MPSPLLIDERVSRKKFDKEINGLINLSSDIRKRGWIIESTTYPIVRVTFLATELNPPAAPLTVDIDFTNFNLWPLSVRFLHPVTFEPIFVPGKRLIAEGQEQQVVVLAHPITREPFLCMPGVREYHSHPQHEGDSWDIHRSGEGSIYVLLEHIWQYCIKSIKAYSIQLSLGSPQVILQQEGQP